VELLGYTDIEVVAVATGGEALEAMLDMSFDCVVLDLRLPDMTGFELLEKVHAEPALTDVPVVVFTGKELNEEEQMRLKAMAKSIIQRRPITRTTAGRDLLPSSCRHRLAGRKQKMLDRSIAHEIPPQEGPWSMTTYATSSP
jgi:CheY-like chemotaxis protein